MYTNVENILNHGTITLQLRTFLWKSREAHRQNSSQTTSAGAENSKGHVYERGQTAFYLHPQTLGIEMFSEPCRGDLYRLFID